MKVNNTKSIKISTESLDTIIRLQHFFYKKHKLSLSKRSLIDELVKKGKAILTESETEEES